MIFNLHRLFSCSSNIMFLIPGGLSYTNIVIVVVKHRLVWYGITKYMNLPENLKLFLKALKYITLPIFSNWKYFFFLTSCASSNADSMQMSAGKFRLIAFTNSMELNSNVHFIKGCLSSCYY